jgi:hypothetical protein
MLLLKGHKIDNNARKRALVAFLIINIVSVTGIVLLIFYPLAKYNFYPKCPWYVITHTYCPGCGTLRGLNRTIHGDVLGMFKSNKMSIIFLPILLWEYIQVWAQVVAGRRLPDISLSRIELYSLVVLIIAYWIGRNFISFLAPY